MLSFMAMDFFAKSPVLSLPILSLGLFMSAFAFVSVRAVLTDKKSLDTLASMPLDDSATAQDKKEGGRE
jgi:hypothetical protein